MKKKYNHLTLEQRSNIEALLKAKVSKKEIAHVLGISESTLYREIKPKFLIREFLRVN